METTQHGAVAAGSAVTADAGAEILRQGGNAVDAAVAACFAMAAGEPALTSLAGGGAMIHRDGVTGEVKVLDFFANAPGLDAIAQSVSEREFFGLDLDFGPTTQRFHIGRGAAAVPGVIPGLCTALERWGSLPLEEVVCPANRVLREGAALNDIQAFAVRILQPIVSLTEPSRAQFLPDGKLLAEGDVYRAPQLADLLDGFTSANWRGYYRERIGAPLLERFGPGAGGLIGGRDLDEYHPILRQPIAVDYHGARIHTNPPPAAGGEMIALMLQLLESVKRKAFDPGDPAHVHALGRAMRVADEERCLVEPGSAFDLDRCRARFRELEGRPLGAAPPCDGGPSSTTHVSVIDGVGNAAAVTVSHGEGCGTIIGDTGIMMNNLMGEEDLFPRGFDDWTPGGRLSTMMSPTIASLPDGSVVALGTGGANRIRTAIVQVLANLVDFGLALEEAVVRPRVHFEQGVLNAEVFDDPGRVGALESLGARTFKPFGAPNLYFGGVHQVLRTPGGMFRAAGDPRRGGVTRIL